MKMKFLGTDMITITDNIDEQKFLMESQSMPIVIQVVALGFMQKTCELYYEMKFQGMKK